MELDDIKQVWSTRFSGLEHRLAGVEAALADRTRRRYRRSLWPTAACAAIETAVAVALAVVVARPTLAQLDSWRYGIAGGATLVVLAGWAALAATRAVRTLRTDAAGAVIDMQRELVRLRRAELATLTWTLLGGTVVWLPLALLAFEAGTGFAALQRVDAAWLLANLGFGGAVAAAAIAFARRRTAASGPAWLDGVAEALSGRGLRRATARLDELREFAADRGDD